MFFTAPELVVPVKGKSAALDRELTPLIAAACGLNTDDIFSYRILKRSVDARKKPDVKLLYRLAVEIAPHAAPVRRPGWEPCDPEKLAARWNPPEHRTNFPAHPLVVGAGPGGLFAALVLALAGCCPVVVERGYDVVRRKQDIDLFFQTRQVNPESNLLYGEGGAGTWSDGKLFTRVRDVRADFVIEQFIAAGASPCLRYFSHPHIGSDVLPGVVAAIRRKIIALGGSFMWGKRVTGVKLERGVCRGVTLSDGSALDAPMVLIASGHSARELIMNLIAQGAGCTLKGFQIGVRIEHPQRFINHMQYAQEIPPAILGAAEYQLSSRPGGTVNGATSFCMCPGGEIIPAVCEPGRLSTNGMSNAARSGEFADSALVTGIPADAFASADAAFNFLERLEEQTFRAGGGDFSVPAQNAVDFLSGRKSRLSGSCSYRLGAVPGRIDTLLPRFASDALRRAVDHFDRVAPGFARNGVLYGIESRVSSPVRFLRREDTLSSTIPNLYLCGEGAGMAGGITSAAIDGIRLAEAMLQIFPDRASHE